MSKTKILLFDIETSPLVSYTWGLWEQNVIKVKEEWYMMSFAAKWLGQKNTQAYSLPDFPLYKKDPKNDRELVKKLWDLLDEADIVIAHHGDPFDVKKTNARFAVHGFPPPSPYKTIDTKKVAKKYFKFESNKLDDLGKYLNVGQKMDTGGFSLWVGCMGGDMESWKKMVKYNKQDVVVLEQVYLKLRPWMTNHPNRNLTEGTLSNCPNCSSSNLIRRGYSFTRLSKRQRFNCKDCNAWSSGATEKLEDIVVR
jgi:hypothetical protein